MEAPDGYRLIIDAGSGIRSLGQALMDRPPGPKLEGDLLLTHLHLDHIMGFAFFKPLLAMDHAITIWAVRPAEEVRDALTRVFGPPIWPIDMLTQSGAEVAELDETARRFGPVEVTPFPLNHPNGAHGYRIDTGAHRICIVSDHEHGNAAIDSRLEREVAGADLMLYDAAYTVDSYPRYRGWGHSHWAAAAKLAETAGVARTILVHHAFDASDETLDSVAEELVRLPVRVEMAHDRLEIPL
ncbi:MAG: MBL fold metallo-hydrolase [Pseudomonadota bacterium]